MKWLNPLWQRVVQEPDTQKRFLKKETRGPLLDEMIASERDTLSDVRRDTPLTEQQKELLMELPDAENLKDLQEPLAELVEKERAQEGKPPTI